AELAAGGQLPAEDQAQMARDMVQRLEARLATQGGSAEEWAQLISSLVVIGNDAHARDILGEARQRFANHADSLALIEQAAQQSGIAE
ncbi:MAG: c-type cytochrome biogenesis protein CcmI, partial [Paracoccus sp. (in: a-proteobacteria)]|nr:c-type cytochrome biogenesis protein CcmI [Paracoccus sp. (in: a-proteobacteria)]